MKGPADEQIFNHMMLDNEDTHCFSCDKEFKAEDQNDRPEGYFCDDCLENKI